MLSSAASRCRRKFAPAGPARRCPLRRKACLSFTSVARQKAIATSRTHSAQRLERQARRSRENPTSAAKTRGLKAQQARRSRGGSTSAAKLVSRIRAAQPDRNKRASAATGRPRHGRTETYRLAWSARRGRRPATRKYLRMSLPSRPCSGAPQLRHVICPSKLMSSPATRTSL
jgi:hypothetical protein